MPVIVINNSKKIYAIDGTDEKTMLASLKLLGYTQAELNLVVTEKKKKKPAQSKKRKTEDDTDKTVTTKKKEKKSDKKKKETNTETIFD